MSLKPVVFVPGLPASELRRRSSQKKVFPPSIDDLLDSATKKQILGLLGGAGDLPAGTGLEVRLVE